MRSIQWTLIMVSMTSLFNAQQSTLLLKLQIRNTLTISRNTESIEIPSKKVRLLAGKNFSIIEAATKKEIPYQWLSNGDLLIQDDFNAKEIKKIEFYQTPPKSVDAKVYGRFVPERLEDFAWENDKIAFRMYGKELEKVPEQNGWGMDAWAKRTHRMVINEWYKQNNYHQDNGDGLDFFQVGRTLGAGDILPFISDDFVYLGNYTSYKIVEEGPLRFTFDLTYSQVKKNGYEISAVKRISLDAGSQLNKSVIKYEFKGEQTLPLFAGIVHWDGKGEKIIDQDNHLAAYWPENSKNGIVGTAIIFPNANYTITDKNKHLGSEIILKNKQTITFYAGAAWDKAGEITSAKDWQKYLQEFSLKLKYPIQISEY
ncbi:DUF4861 domain-containing protein [Chryseobacterium sp. T16E-39]|uniref:DUF4861 family protein n=1 Tax=Chryseobacterium sp. T16E-39 TaxID=2015076 RepID=UPI000B5B1B6E|nr:DUF4861 family protein [Chryseobacterium sp. T16E-39]ASK32030.1 DUF4861 domain-containing protein [Chryseobacterium sp. T16E-39]